MKSFEEIFGETFGGETIEEQYEGLMDSPTMIFNVMLQVYNETINHCIDNIPINDGFNVRPSYNDIKNALIKLKK